MVSETVARVSGSRVPKPSSMNRLSRFTAPRRILHLPAELQGQGQRGEEGFAAAQGVADPRLVGVVVVDHQDLVFLKRQRVALAGQREQPVRCTLHQLREAVLQDVCLEPVTAEIRGQAAEEAVILSAGLQLLVECLRPRKALGHRLGLLPEMRVHRDEILDFALDPSVVRAGLIELVV